MRALVLIATLTAVSCTNSPRPLLSLEPCHVDGLAELIACGQLDVAEDRSQPDGRRLSIHVAVLPPLRRGAARDPLFMLAGGPGQGARGLALAAGRFFKQVRRHRAIILVDLRGTGASNPLDCTLAGDEIAGLAGDPAAIARECATQLPSDPRLYTHTESLRDLDEVRRALGYERINLWGGSWGTRAALLYALRFPDATRAVVLDGAAALTLGFPATVSADAQRALARLVTDCRRDPACHDGFPDPAADIARFEARFVTDAVPVTLRHPRTHAWITVTLSRGLAFDIVRGALYTPQDAAAILQVVRSAADGDFAPLAAQFVRTAAVTTDDMRLGATFSVLCSEDVPTLDARALEDAARGSVFGTAYGDTWRARCGSWPQGRPLAESPSAVSQAPALILSGDHDPVTPPARGEQMARHFPHHRHVIVPAAAHNTSFLGCVPDLIAAFLEHGSADALETTCVNTVTWPPFVVGLAGSRP